MSVKVLVVDDSPTVRAVLRRLLAAHADLAVVAEASNGEEAVQAVLRLAPDVILMDVEMPVMDGFAAIEHITRLRPTPILVLTSRANRDRLATAFEAIRRGALEVLPKPASPGGWEELAQRLPELLRTASRLARAAKPAPAPETPPAVRARPVEYLLLGASTGGPGAVREFLLHLGEEVAAPVAVVQHIAAGFEEGLASWLAKETQRDVQVLANSETPPPRAVRLAPAGAHLVLQPSGVLALDTTTPPRGGHRPSVDVLFASAVHYRPAHTVAILFSGMGSDGAQGLLALKQAGAVTAVQSEASAAIFGMPRQALELGAAEVALSPQGLARFVTQLCGGKR
jgi:two-component system chemotaxis response regulator CheB